MTTRSTKVPDDLAYPVCGTTGTPGSWTGVLRRGRRVIATCGHTHANRDLSTGVNVAAYDCMQWLVRSAVDKDTADQCRSNLRAAAARAARAYAATERQTAEWCQRGEQNVAAMDAKLPELRDLLGNAPVLGRGPTIVTAPRPVPCVPCPRCAIDVKPTRWIPNPAGAGEGSWLDWTAVTTSVFATPRRCAGDRYYHPAPVAGTGAPADTTPAPCDR